MTKYRCKSCGGVYSDCDEEGYAYFHVCPEGTNMPRNENLVSINVDKPKIKAEGKGRTKI